MKLSPVKPTDKRLRAICKPVTLRELRRNDTQKLIKQMLDYVYGRVNKGAGRTNEKPMIVGLSANQLGINKRISIVDFAIGRKGFSDVHVMINPVITWKSKSVIKKYEGCVNLPEVWGEIGRSARVKAEYIDRSGNRMSVDARGWLAVLLQHEIDHLDGKLFIDKLPNPKKALFVKEGELRRYRKEKKHWKQFKDVSKLVKIKSR